jgi:cytochrome c2
VADVQTAGRDPVVHGSLNWHITIASAILALSVFWAFYDEIYAKRPWKKYQAEFVDRYSAHLKKVEADAVTFEKGLMDDAELKALREKIAAAQATAKPTIEQIDKRTNDVINPRIQRLTKAMQGARSEVMALTYELEHADAKRKAEIEKELEEVKGRTINVPRLIKLDGSGEENGTYVYHTLAVALDESKAQKAELIRQRAKAAEPERTLQSEYDKLVARKQPELSSVQIAGLVRKMDTFKSDIKQIHIPDPIGLVDRCESCHLGVREPLTLTPEDLGGEHAKAFVSHPTPELLQIHDPDRFGCSTCHGGNGSATISPKEGHGRIHHWLWPMYEKENTEAGCLQCHESSLVLDHATTLNEGKELFRYRGCWGCHPRAGFDTERAEQRLAAQSAKTVREQIDQYRFEIDKQNKIADNSKSSDEDVKIAIGKINSLTLQISGLESELIELERREVSLGKQLKNVGPSLRPIRNKLKPEWVTQWIDNPRHFRPTTRMPVFRLPPEHLNAISAAVWQNSDEAKTDPHEKGDVAKGKQLFESRGCQGCHAIEKDATGKWLGGGFGPELSRVGEKANYDYVVEWVKDTPDWSIMPNLRLSAEDARDIASFLIEHRDPNAKYEGDTAHLTDASLKEKGEALIRHYGCAGCHDIRGFEAVGKIGTDLTTEGNKPIDRLDYGLYTKEAKRNHLRNEHHEEHSGPDEIEYTHKSFFQHKLNKPEFFDDGKTFEDELSKLRMPNFGLSEQENVALTTFLLGSVDSAVPNALKDHPEGRAKDIADGWWVIKKYNCMGCHQVVPGQVPDIAKLPQYQGDKGGNLPPTLVGVGARLNPEWLAKFLRNPALNDHDLERNGVRTYLAVRMPTFNLWDEEIGTLVRFFAAMADQTMPYFPPHYPALTTAEHDVARKAFLDMDCLNCHASAEQTTFDASVIAPNFVQARDRLKPSWMERWLVDPGKLMIGTKMPTGLFKQDEHRRIVAGTMSDELKAYADDHVKLFVRYINAIDNDEAAALKQIKDAEKVNTPKSEEKEEFIEDQ